MQIDTLSSGADGAHNEDLIAVFEHRGVTDIVILDGGTSVADKNYIDDDMGDVVWFVRNFCEVLKDVLDEAAHERKRPARSQEDCLALALGALRARLHAQADRAAIPDYAWPIAAMTWLRVRQEGGDDEGNGGDGGNAGESAINVEVYCLGDCKSFACLPDRTVLDLDPYVNPQELVLQTEILKLRQSGVTGADARRALLMPMLRERRAFLNASPAPTVLCLAPRGPFAARTRTVALAPGAALLAMTDGFYRIVDTYHLLTDHALADLCLRQGLAAAHTLLRDHEAGKAPSQGGAAAREPNATVKSADDASAVLAAFGQEPGAA